MVVYTIVDIHPSTDTWKVRKKENYEGKTEYGKKIAKDRGA